MQQKIETAKASIHAKVSIPGSKKITHRAILLAALADGVSELSGIQLGHHTKLFIEALRQVGIVIQIDEKSQSCIIAGGNGQFPKKQATIWCDQAKLITYFMIGACSGSQGVYYFDGSEHFRKTKINHLLHLLRRQGVQIIPNDKETLPFTLISSDTLEGGEIIFNRKEHLLSQLFLMIAPFARTPFNLSLIDPNHNDDIDLTCAIMAEFGVLVHRLHQSQLMVPVPQRYHARDYAVEPDFSLACYFFAAAAVTGGEITIQPTKRNMTKQSTIKVLSVLEKMGCQVIERHYGLSLVGPKELKGIEISMREFSDTFLIVAALAPFANKPTYISHVGKISPKEAEYVKKMKKELAKLNIHVEAGADWLKIFPGKMKTPCIIHSNQDYRLAMAFAIIGLKQSNIIIEETECVTKIFPDFFTIWNKLAEPINVSA